MTERIERAVQMPNILAKKWNRGNLHWQAFEGRTPTRTAEIYEPTHLPVLDSFPW